MILLLIFSHIAVFFLGGVYATYDPQEIEKIIMEDEKIEEPVRKNKKK